MARNIVFAPGEFFHLYNRGTEKRNIFITAGDRARFLALLYLCNGSTTNHISNYPSASFPKLFTLMRGTPLVDICAYCLMPNHFHLLVQEQSDSGISRFMQRLLTGYTMYFNARHERTGALFQSKFKATHAGEDRYLKYLISYIHLNPVKLIEPMWKETGIVNRKKAEAYLQTYRYSSFLDYLGETRPESVIINKGSLPKYFETPNSFKESMTEWLLHQQAWEAEK